MSLDDTLAAWAATVRLPDAAAEGIYQQIVTAQPPAAGVFGGRAGTFGGVGRTWWRDFSAGFADRMVASTRPVPWAA